MHAALHLQHIQNIEMTRCAAELTIAKFPGKNICRLFFGGSNILLIVSVHHLEFGDVVYSGSKAEEELPEGGAEEEEVEPVKAKGKGKGEAAASKGKAAAKRPVQKKKRKHSEAEVPCFCKLTCHCHCYWCSINVPQPQHQSHIVNTMVLHVVNTMVSHILYRLANIHCLRWETYAVTLHQTPACIVSG